MSMCWGPVVPFCAGVQQALGCALLHGAGVCHQLAAAAVRAVCHTALDLGGGLCCQLLCHSGASLAHRIQVRDRYNRLDASHLPAVTIHSKG